jgi:uncharacterized iron-regulated protein
MPPSRLALLLLAGGLAAGCAPRPLTPRAIDPRPYGPDWSSPLLREHPLAGRILDVKGRRWIDQAALDAALARADFLVLGEVHDNPDHHRLQAREVRAVAAAGRIPALAFEMLSTPAQAKLDAAQAVPGVTADAIAEAVEWSKGGWPEFALYRPIFEAGLTARLRLVAANLSRPAAREVMKQGVGTLPDDTRAWLGRAPAPTPAELEALRKEMAEDHCGELPESLVKPLVLAQRARDAELAVRTAAAGRERGAILVAGDGHARNDRGVPAWLVRELPGKAVVAVGHLEVQAGLLHPDDYAAEAGVALPFDYVVFTPGTEREDPCLELKKKMDEKKAGGAAARP